MGGQIPEYSNDYQINSSTEHDNCIIIIFRKKKFTQSCHMASENCMNHMDYFYVTVMELFVFFF